MLIFGCFVHVQVDYHNKSTLILHFPFYAGPRGFVSFVLSVVIFTLLRKKVLFVICLRLEQISSCIKMKKEYRSEPGLANLS